MTIILDLPAILGPSVTDADVSVKDNSLRFLEKEGIEVVLDGFEVSSRDIRDGRQQDGTGLGGVSAGNKAGVTSGQSVVPQGEQSTDLILGDILSGGGLDNLRLAGEERAKSHVQLGGGSRGGDASAVHSLDDRGRRGESIDTRGVEGSRDGGGGEDGGASELHFELCCV